MEAKSRAYDFGNPADTSVQLNPLVVDFQMPVPMLPFVLEEV
jgi:hypothetical protein